MRQTFRNSTIGAAIAGLFLSAALPLAAQATISRGPRTADGKPNLNGIWQVLTEANWDLHGHAAAAGPMIPLGAIGAMPPGQGVVEGEEIPYKPEALATKKANFANRLKLDPEVKCYLPGVPRATYMPFPFQIVQTPQFILISYEYANAARTIYMKDPGPAPVDSWMGQSVGHWEGDTLVVDVTGFNDQSWFDRAGDYHTDALHVAERYTLHGADSLMYEATIKDEERIHQAVEDQHADLPPPGEERSIDGIQVRGICGRINVRAVSQEACELIGGCLEKRCCIAILIGAAGLAVTGWAAPPPKPASYTPPRTADGQPDIQGVWNNATLTPLERPAAMASKAFLTPAEAAAYEKQAVEQNNRDRRGTDATSDLAGAYNQAWFDRGPR